MRMLAEVMLHADPASVASAEAMLRDAADLADKQGVAMLGLRVAVTAARLDARLGDVEQAARRVAGALSRIARGRWRS